MIPPNEGAEESVDSTQASPVDLDALEARSVEFERLNAMLGRLRMLRLEQRELLQGIKEADNRLGHLELEIDKQGRQLEKQLLLIERTNNG